VGEREPLRIIFEHCGFIGSNPHQSYTKRRSIRALQGMVKQSTPPPRFSDIVIRVLRIASDGTEHMSNGQSFYTVSPS